MDIGRTEGVQGPGRIEGKKVERITPPPSTPTPAPVDRVDISPAGQLVAQALAMPEVRLERVAEIKRLIDAGIYQTDDKLLGALISFIRENPDVV